MLYTVRKDFVNSNHYLIRALEINKKMPFISFDIVPDHLFYM